MLVTELDAEAGLEILKGIVAVGATFRPA